MCRDTSRIGRNENSDERAPDAALTPRTLPCVDCGQVGMIQVERGARRQAVPYLCPACLAARVAAVQALPPVPIRGRGRKKKRRTEDGGRRAEG